MRGFTSSLWPIRYKPLPDELLSSWLVRLAHGQGLKVQTFCNVLFGNQLQVWNRDIDRLGPSWLVDELSYRTGTPLSAAHGTTLRGYEGHVFSVFRPAGSLSWIQTLQMYHRKRTGFGLQFCPKCLSEGPEPYYRRSWRVTFNTICTKHNVMLRDRCPQCGAGVSFHRLDVGKKGALLNESLAICHQCDFDLCHAKSLPIVSYDDEASQWHRTRCEQLHDLTAPQSHLNLEILAVAHQIAFLLTTGYTTVALRAHVCKQLSIRDIPLAISKMSLESRPLNERHHLIQLTGWLMSDLESRLRTAWLEKAIRYNLMSKDFNDAPDWYLEIVAKFSNWRGG